MPDGWSLWSLRKSVVYWMGWIQQWGKMFDRNHKESFMMRDWCSGEEENCRRTVDLQANKEQHKWALMDPSQWAVHVWVSSIRDHDDRANMSSVHALQWSLVLSLLLGMCNRLTFSIKLPGHLHCLWAHYRDNGDIECFVSQRGLSIF